MEGLWSGRYRAEGAIGSFPAQLHLEGSAECNILRHKDADLEVEMEGTTPASRLSVRINSKTIEVPVQNNKFRHTLRLKAAELGNQSWCTITLFQPGAVVDSWRIRESKKYPKMLIFALDGATWRVLGKLAQEKRVPHFQKLMENGTHGVLHSVEESLSPVIWTTIATGKDPEQHGIHDFLDQNRSPVHSGQVLVKRIWNITTEHSPYTTGVLGWYVTWPAEPISGFMISDHAYQERASVSKEEHEKSFYPPSIRPLFESVVDERQAKLLEEVKRFTSFPFDPKFRKTMRPKTPIRRKHDLLWRRLYHAYLRDSIYSGTGLELYRRLQPDMLFLYFRGNDYTQHAYWKYMDPTGSKVPPSEEDREYFKDIIPKYYIYLDEVIDRFMDAAAPDTSFVVVSDHGFTILPEENARQLSGTHEKEGVYIFSGSSFRKNFKLDGLSIYDICPLLLYQMGLPVAQDMRGKVPLEVYESSARREPALIASYGSNSHSTQESMPSEIDEEIMEQLRTLGYIGN